LEAFFLTLGERRLLCTFHAPPAAAEPDGVLLLPPFAEEMNQTRSFHARVAQSLAARGVAALSVDLSATGDSSGELRDAAWADWEAEIAAARDWLRARCRHLFALAVGSAALHVPALGAAAGRGPARLCLVDPVCDGERLLEGFLRAKVARSMFEGRRESVASLRARLAGGELVEVAGYELPGRLAEALAGVRLRAEHLAGLASLQLVCSQEQAGAAVPPALEQTFADLHTAGALQRVVLDYNLVWSNERPEPPPELLAAVTNYFTA